MANRTCTIPDCGKKRNGRLYCSGHEQRWRKTGDPQAAVPLRVKRSGCKVAGCVEKHYGNGLCAGHAQRLRKTGRLDPDKPFRSSGPCSISGCTKTTYGDMCVWHARRANSGIDPESPAKIQGDPVMNGSGLRLCADCRNWCDADDFPQAYGHKHTCGPCLRAKRSDYALDRSTKIKSNFVEHVDRLTVYERDGWICQICMSPIDRELKFPARMSPSVDHIVPVSHGGDHSYENVRASHLTCNIKRGNRTRVA